MERDYETPDRKFRLFVRSPDGDVTIGFDGFLWHTHGDILAAVAARQSVFSFWASRTRALADEIIEKHVQQYVDDLIDCKSIIIIVKDGESIRDVWISEDPAAEIRDCPQGMTVEFRLWDGTAVPGQK